MWGKRRRKSDGDGVRNKDRDITHHMPPHFTPSNELHASLDRPPVVQAAIRTDRGTGEVNYGRRTEVARADASLGMTVVREDVDIFHASRIDIVDGHQPRTSVPSDPKFHGDNTICFLHIKGEEFSRVELHETWSGTIKKRGVWYTH